MPQPDHPTRQDPEESQQTTPGELGFLFVEVVDSLPEFLPRYLELTAAADDDLGEPLVLMELAEFVTDRLESTAVGEQVLGRALGLVEAIAGAGDDTDVDLVRYAFLDSFRVEDRQRLLPLLGPCSRRLLETLETMGAPEPEGGR